MDRIKLGLVTAGFLGCSPVAPGTVGTLAGVGIAWSLRGSDNFLVWILLICALLYLLGRALGPWTESHLGKDPGCFVLDEVIGYLITVLWVQGPSTLTLVVAFALFRFFDVLKPGPVRRMEQIPGADGILLDDVVAGLMGLAVMVILRSTVGEAGIWEWGGMQ